MSAHTWWRIDVTSHDGSSNYHGFCDAELRTSVGGATACTGGTASASSTLGGYDPSYVVDGNPATAWLSTAVTSAWWAYHFASPVDIVEMAVTVQSSRIPYFPHTIGLSYSDDGSSWVVAISPKLGHLSATVYPDLHTWTARVTGADANSYWRLHMTEADGSQNPAIASIELHATPGGADLISGALEYADSINAVYATLYQVNAFDANSGTYFVGQIGGPFPNDLIWKFPADISEPVEYAITFFNGTSNQLKGWTLDYSGDGITWTQADAQSGVPDWSALETRTYSLTGGGSTPARPVVFFSM